MRYKILMVLLFFIQSALATDLSTKEERLVLSIDGWGIRGLIPATLLSWLEEQIEVEVKKHHDERSKRYPNAPTPEVRLGECFDVIAGTSTGGVLALGMRFPDPSTHRPRFKVSTFRDLYEQDGKTIFPQSDCLYDSEYNPEPFEKKLNDFFKDTMLKDLKKPTLITTFDLHQNRLYIFDSLQAHFPSNNYKLKDIARATSADLRCPPGVFIKNEKEETLHCLEGGIVANNPTLEAYMEAKKLYPNDKIHFISLGCGRSPLFLNLENEKSSEDIQVANDKSRMIMSQGSTMVDYHMNKLTALAKDRYTRIQLSLDKTNRELDEVSEKNITYLKAQALKEINKPSSPLHALRQKLLDRYKKYDYLVYHDLLASLSPSEGTLSLKGQRLSKRAFWEVGYYLTQKKVNISTLILDEVPLTPDLLTYIDLFPHLQTLSLNKTGLTLEGLKTLREHQPSCLKTLSLKENPKLLEGSEKDLIFYLKNYTRLTMDGLLSNKIGSY